MKRFITMLVVSAIAFMACKKEEAPKPPVFNVTSEKTMNFEAAGGNGTITYTIENPSEDLSVIAQCEAEWVTDITEGTSVTFTVVANESLEARSTEITVSYGESVQKVSVSQAGRVPNPVLTLTSDATMPYTYEGGAGTITYTLEDPKPGVEVTATCAQDWITDITVGDQITFNVAENEENEAREATIAVAYGDLGFDVKVTQEGNPVIKFVAACLDAQYYGTEYSDYNNYYVILSDNGLDAAGAGLSNSTYFYFDMYSVTPNSTADIVIPNGVYTFDPDDSFTANTFSNLWSRMITTKEGDNSDVSYYSEGTMTVTSEGIEVLLETENGEKYRVVYEGAPVIEGEPLSNLEDDYSADSDNGYFYAENWGDYFEIGKNDWLVSVYTEAPDPETGKSSGEVFMLELLNDSSDDIVGTYSPMTMTDALAGNATGNTYLIGEYEQDGEDLYPLCSWLLSIVNNVIDGEIMAPMAEGEVVITKNEDVYTFTYNGYDDAGNKITASIDGYAGIYDYSDYSVPAAKTNNLRKMTPKMSSNAGNMLTKTKNVINF